MARDLEPIGPVVDGVLGALGVDDVRFMGELRDRWLEVAPKRWADHSEPSVLRAGELVVEADKGAIPLLRYAVSDLLSALDKRFGEGRVSTIRIVSVRAPGTAK